MMDLVVALAPFVDEATMTKTFGLIRLYLEVKLCVQVILIDYSIIFFITVTVHFPACGCMCSDQGPRAAEEGVPCAGGDVWRREGRVQGVCCRKFGNTQSCPVGDFEERLFTSEAGVVHRKIWDSD